jgi:hypothetical protein
MAKDNIIAFLEEDHKKLEKAIAGLIVDQMTEYPIVGRWTVKDIIAHIAAWNLELTGGINAILSDQKPRFFDIGEDEFNRREIERRNLWTIKQVLDEWQRSFHGLIGRIRKISDAEWEYEAPSLVWPDGSQVSVEDLFGYRYKGEGHEGGHAKQIEGFFCAL